MKNTTIKTDMVLKRDDSQVYSEVDGLSLQNLFYVKNSYFPNCYMFTRPSKGNVDNYFDTPSLLKMFIEKTPEDENMQYLKYTTFNLETSEEKVGFSIIFNKSNIFARFEHDISESYVLYGNDNEEALGELIKSIKNFYIAPKEEKNNMFMVARDPSGYKLNKWHINECTDFSISKQYNDDFAEADDIIDDFISKDDKSGIVLLHGEKGTGKSTYIRNLISRFPNRKFVFIPSSILPMLNDPSFSNFLLTLSNSVLILEDCEGIIKSRKEGDYGGSVSLLLNISDGLVSDYLSIKCICTFNAAVKDIDEALLRKGRLVCDYEFKKLEKEKVAKLIPEVIDNKLSNYQAEIDELEESGKTERIDRIENKIQILNEYKNEFEFEDMTLADIYNIEDKSFIKKQRKIGF